jgi:hypothetical protein
MHAEHDDMIACIQTVADHGGLTTVVVGIAVGANASRNTSSAVSHRTHTRR